MSNALLNAKKCEWVPVYDPGSATGGWQNRRCVREGMGGNKAKQER